MPHFDQPELHPRGFPLWVNILLVSALILAPLVVVFLIQLWQEKQAVPNTTVTQPATKSETSTTVETSPSSDLPKQTDVDEKTETVPAPAQNKSDSTPAN